MNRRAAVAGAAAAVLAPPLRARASAADPTVLHLAAPPTDASAQYYYADAAGIFKKAGLAYDIAHLANGEAVTAGVIGGSIDIGVSQAISLITAFSKGIPITVIAGSAINVRGAAAGSAGAFFVPKNSTATSGKDLIGKTVGVQGLRGFAQYGTQDWLDQTGGDSSTVHFVEMTSSVMGRALADNRLDGAFIPEPFVSQVAKVAKKISNPMDVIAPTFYLGAHFTTLAWARAHADLVRRFERVMYETAVWARENRDQSAVILANAAGIDVETVRSAVRVEYSSKRDPALLQPMISLAAKYGGITPFPAEAIFFKG